MKKMFLLCLLFFQIHVHGSTYLLLRSLIYADSAYIGLKSAKTNEPKYLLYGAIVGLPFIIERIKKIGCLNRAIAQLTDTDFVTEDTRKDNLDHARYLLNEWEFGFGAEFSSPSNKYSDYNNDQLTAEETTQRTALTKCFWGTVTEATLASIVTLVIPGVIYAKTIF